MYLRLILGLALAATLAIACGDDGGGSAGDASGSSGSAGTASTSEGTSAGTSAGSASETGSGSESGGADLCTSQKYWTLGDMESPEMHPGRACLTCHATQVDEDVATKFQIAGTVYPTFRDPDECYGVDGAAGAVIVEITTADARVLNLPVNAAGNFMYDQEEDGPLAFPFTARVLRDGKAMVMATPQSSGDCNACHTAAGMNGAPGRILAP